MGAYISVDIDGEQFRLSPHEMPGEIEWRIDFIHWLVARTACQLLAQPRDERIAALVALERDLIRKTNLHPIEAQVVAEGALLTLGDIDEEKTWLAKPDELQLDVDVKREGDVLLSRYRSLIRQYGRRKGPESAGMNPDARPTDWNWSQFLDW
ncbi:hypothetical protein ACFPTO_20065 [Paraburkholderia denitrificans]|uniref:DUF29 domain-containing protein n=1 Tax=Paraburkholderia denitrificans TaxID=694025 RepID=A0ABW0JD63_9BURK